jgi:hypothetical protein
MVLFVRIRGLVLSALLLMCARGHICTTDSESGDGIFCNGIETCDLDTGSCQAGSLDVYDDEISCTFDWCDGLTDLGMSLDLDDRCVDNFDAVESCSNPLV